MKSRSYSPRWDRYQAWANSVGDNGVVYLPLGYSALGHLLHYWMGIEGTIYASCDWPDSLRAFVDQVNANNLLLIDLVASSPAEIILMGDNFSSDIQPPRFFASWSQAYYVEAIHRLHAAGKRVAIHIDGRLRGSLSMIHDAGADAADAVTPTPMGDLAPAECRDEAGTDFILSGGVSPDLWLPDVPIERFKRAVTDWLALSKRSPRLIAAAGDQVPPGAAEDRIKIMRDLVERHGGVLGPGGTEACPTNTGLIGRRPGVVNHHDVAVRRASRRGQTDREGPHLAPGVLHFAFRPRRQAALMIVDHDLAFRRPRAAAVGADPSLDDRAGRCDRHGP